MGENTEKNENGEIKENAEEIKENVVQPDNVIGDTGEGSASGAENAADGENSKKKKPPVIEDVYDWVEVFTVSVAIVILMLSFVARLARVEGNSMNMTLSNNDILIITNLGDEPKQGDIVVVQQLGSYFKNPLVKRVIAKGGQTIIFDFDEWSVTVDGVKLDEPYVNKKLGAMKRLDLQSNVVYVPEGYVFVMGDNRNESSDSRSNLVGFVRENEMIGKVVFRLLPMKKISSGS